MASNVSTPAATHSSPESTMAPASNAASDQLATTISNKETATTSFFSLPQEVHQIIYSYVLFTRHDYPLIHPNHRCTRKDRALLRTCKQIHAEALPTFYHINKFKLDIGTKLPTTLSVNLRHMNYIILRHRYRCAPKDKEISAYLQLVLDRCRSLKTFVLLLEPNKLFYTDEESVASVFRNPQRMEHTLLRLAALLPRVQDILAIVATMDIYNYNFTVKAGLTLPIAPDVKRGAKNFEAWFPKHGKTFLDVAEEEDEFEGQAVRCWIFSAKGWETRRWLKNNRGDF